MMEHCEGYGNTHRLHSDNMPDNKFNSYDSDDQVDSGLGSLGYVSGGDLYSYNSARIHIEAITEEDGEANNKQSNNKDSGVVDSSTNTNDIVHSLDRLYIDVSNNRPTDSNSNRCDSGLVEDTNTQDLHDIRPNATKFDLTSANDSNYEYWVSPHFPHSPEQIIDIFSGDEDGDNHLHLSIIHALPEVSMQVISLAPDWEWLNHTNNLMQTPLHLAVITRQIPVIRRLMCAGAAVDVRDLAGNTPLHNACRLGFEDVVRTLLMPVICEETYQNRYETTIQRLPQDTESKNYEGLTCLHLAAIGGHFSVMRLLLTAGANVNVAEGKGGRTVLHLATDWGHIDMLKYLLSRRDTNINAKTYSGLTPILLAYGRSHLEAVEELYKKGASCETLSLNEESDGDISDEDMMDVSSSHNHNSFYNAAAGRAFQPTNR